MNRGEGNAAGGRASDVPVIDKIEPAQAVPGTAIVITGEGFGTARAGGRVTFALESEGAPTADATISAWQDTQIVAEVPDLAALGSGGPAVVVIATRTGESAPAAFVVLEPAPPEITFLDPRDALAGDEIRIAGRGFGLARFGGDVLFAAEDIGEVAAEVTAWTPSEIRVPLPPLDRLGVYAVRVRTVSGTSEPQMLTVGAEPTLSALPVLMLPVRIETRYSAGGSELRILVVPDDCAVDSFERELTPDERASAQAYQESSPAQRETLWRGLVARFGAGRASWLAHAPLTGQGAVGSRTATWTRAPVTRVLPRRWYAFGYKGDTRVFSAWGRPVADELPVGPDPRAFGVTVAGDGPPVDEGMRWMIDFEAARERGMGIHVALPQEARGRLDRLVVLGVRPGTPETGSRDRVQALLQAHRYTRGLAFVDEGTPTNNTRGTPSGFDSGAVPPPADPRRPVPAPSPGAHLDAVATALGLERATLAGVQGAASGKAANDGRTAMKTVLWRVTLGYFLEQLLAGAIGRPMIEAVRAHFIDWVRSAGPLPPLRIGNQPYGLLPVTPLSQWQPRGADVPAGVVNLLNRARPVWRDSVASVPRVERSGVDIREDLLATLAIQPVSISYRGRSTLGADYVSAAWRFLRERLPETWWQAQSAAPRAFLNELGVSASPRLETATFASNYFRLPTPPVEKDPPAGGANPLRANYLDWFSRTTTERPGYRSIRDETFPEIGSLPPPRPLLYLLVRHSLLLEYAAAVGRLSQADAPGPERELVGVDEIDDSLGAPREPTPWDRLAAPGAGPDAPKKGRWLDLNDAPDLGTFRASLRTLKDLPVRTLERLLAETLDVCSHRLDAWATSIASRRLADLRPTGVHLGGWGAVFELEPDPGLKTDPVPRASRGFIAAPSLAHATAAAILGSAYSTHSIHAGRHPFAIDLSSERVRLAMWLLSGVRSGQLLGALLGYRFERALHEAEPPLDEYVDDFRRFAPLQTGASPTGGAAGGAVSAVMTHNVVDGLELHRRWVAANRKLERDWPSVADGDRAGVAAALAALDDIVDAVGDVLLAEGAFQAARGNPARAAAALDAAAGKGPPPAELEVLQTPRSGLGIIHRLLVLLPGGAPPGSDWAPAGSQTPRAAAEPRLEALAAKLLGSPARALAAVEYLDADRETVLRTRSIALSELEPRVSALDTVYAAEAQDRPQRSELEERVLYHAARTRPADLPDTTVARLAAEAAEQGEASIPLGALMEAARAVRDAITGARALTGQDLSTPEQPADGSPGPELETRAVAALDSLEKAKVALQAATRVGATSDALRNALLPAARFGVVGAIPSLPLGDTDADRSTLRRQADPVLAEVARRTAAATAIPALPANAAPDARRDRAHAVLNAVFGPGFRALPVLSFENAGATPRLDLKFGSSTTLTGGDRLAPAVWLQRAARVRDGARRLFDALTYAEALTAKDSLRLEVDQLPSRGGDRWIALPFPPGDPPAGRLSFVGLLPLGAPQGQAVAGLLVDEWPELLPSDDETAALAFQFDAPGEAPQTMVLAVPPREAPWTVEMLEQTVLQTLELAQARMVDLDALQRAGHFLPAIHLALNLRGATIATDLKHGSGVSFSTNQDVT